MGDRSLPDIRKERKRRYKHGEYKEDCTNGQFSILNPKTFKGDALVQVWMDSRELATISNWLDKNGSYTRFLSEVVKDSLHGLCEKLVESGEVEMVEDTTEARYLLEKKYRINLNPDGRGEKNVLHNIILSNRKREERESVPDRTRELQRKAKEIYRDTEGKKSSLFDELERIEKGENYGTDESKDDEQGV